MLGNGTITAAGTRLTNEGTITINSNRSGAARQLVFDGDVLLDGAGTFLVNHTSICAQLNTSEDSVVTQAAGHTVRGSA